MIYPWFSGNSAHGHTVTSRVSVVLASTVWQAGPCSRTDALGREVMGWGPSKQTGTGGLAAQRPWMITSLAQAHVACGSGWSEWEGPSWHVAVSPRANGRLCRCTGPPSHRSHS